MEQEVKFEDEDSYNFSYNKDGITFKQIILFHLKSIGKFSSVEFMGGYWEDKVNQKTGEVYRVYIADSREVYSNSVECFADMLFPHFDKEMREALEGREKEIKEAREEHTTTSEGKPINDNEEIEGREKNKVFETVTHRVSYRSVKRKINRKLFRDLCTFLYRKKYLEMGAIED